MTSREITRARWIVMVVVRVAAFALLTWSAIGVAAGIPEYSKARKLSAAGMAPRTSFLAHFKHETTCAAMAIAFPFVVSVLIRRIVPATQHACASCGYDIGILKQCPECGAQA
jgi:hypothetical protein